MSPALVCDSNAQLPGPLIEQHDVRVVPINVVVDGVSYAEEVDIDVDRFYELLAEGAEVTTSQPSPGDFLAAYLAAVEDGADEIVSIHVGSALSGTCNSARLGAELAAERTGVRVHIVDTGLTSFSIGCAILAAAEERAVGGGAAEMVDAAEALTDRVNNVFVTGGLELAAASGRVDLSDFDTGDGVPVLSFMDGSLDVVANVDDLDGAAEVMARTIVETPGRLRVGIGVGDQAMMPFYDLLDDAISEQARDRVEVIRYRCGPSVGAFTGPGTAGACWVALRD